MSISRRYFFFGSLLAGAVPTGGYGTFPSLKALGYKPYYDKLNVAAIGCGGRGAQILNDAAETENIVALGDFFRRGRGRRRQATRRRQQFSIGRQFVQAEVLVARAA